MPTDDGLFYLAVVINAFSRKVVGLSISERIIEKVATDTIEQASGRSSRPTTEPRFPRRPGTPGVPWDCPVGVEAEPPLDNAIAESFFKALKRELVKERHYRDREETSRDIFMHIEPCYNRVESHSHLSYMPPDNYKRRWV